MLNLCSGSIQKMEPKKAPGLAPPKIQNQKSSGSGSSQNTNENKLWLWLPQKWRTKKAPALAPPKRQNQKRSALAPAKNQGLDISAPGSHHGLCASWTYIRRTFCLNLWSRLNPHRVHLSLVLESYNFYLTIAYNGTKTIWCMSKKLPVCF